MKHATTQQESGKGIVMHAGLKCSGKCEKPEKKRLQTGDLETAKKDYRNGKSFRELRVCCGMVFDAAEEFNLAREMQGVWE